MKNKNIPIDWEGIRKELFEKEKIGQPGSGITILADACLKKARNLARPRIIISGEKKITAVRPGRITVAGSVSFSGKRLSSYLAGATHLRIFLTTLGKEVEDEASRKMSGGEEPEGYLLDRIASFAVESLARNLEEALRVNYLSKNKSLSMRVSPGYCDWPLEEQRTLKKAVNFSRAGVKLTKSCMMIPRKSISGLIGIGPKGHFSIKRSPCAVCDMSGCNYKRV